MPRYADERLEARTSASWTESNTWCPRRTAAMILSGSAVQVKGLGIGCLFDQAVDADLLFEDGSEEAALQSSFGELGEEALDGVEPEQEVGTKWNVKRGFRLSQAHLRALVSGIVVEDDMD